MDTAQMLDSAEVSVAQSILAGARRVTVLTGAGISTDSGIADFRGPEGVWTKDPEAEKISTLSEYLSNPDVRRRAWSTRLASPMWGAQPNAGHIAITHLETTRRLDTLVTQNIDGLHHAAGTSPERIVEIHGNARRAVCWSCGTGWPMGEVLSRVASGEDDPHCREVQPGSGECGGIIKSATISFGQSLVAHDVERAEDAALRCDVLLAVGSSLTVHPAASLVPLAAQNGASIVIVNAQETPYDPYAEAVLREPISQVLPIIVR